MKHCSACFVLFHFILFYSFLLLLFILFYCFFLEGLMLKLKLQYFGHLMWRADSFEKTLMLGRIEGRRKRGRQRIRWLDPSPTQRTWVWVDSGSWWWTGRPGILRFMGSQRVRHDWELNWTELNYFFLLMLPIGSKLITAPAFWLRDF